MFLTLCPLSDLMGFSILSQDIQSPLLKLPALKQIYHLACPASPTQYQKDPIGTLGTCYKGTENLLQYATQNHVRILLSSTSGKHTRS